MRFIETDDGHLLPVEQIKLIKRRKPGPDEIPVDAYTIHTKDEKEFGCHISADEQAALTA